MTQKANISVSRIKAKAESITFAVWLPFSDRVVQSIRAAIEANVPFACLIAWDMLRYIAQNQDRTVDDAIDRQVRQGTKIALTRTGYVWLVHNLGVIQPAVLTCTERKIMENIQDRKGAAPCDCCTSTKVQQHQISAEKVSPWVLAVQKARNYVTTIVPDDDAFGEQSQWIELQQQEIFQFYKENDVLRDDNTGMYFCNTEEGFRIYVPKRFRRALCERHHKLLLHASAMKTQQSLAQRFTWPTLAKDAREWVQHCDVCMLLKATKRLCDKRFSARIDRLPRTHYAMDYLGVAKNKQGFCNVLAIIDLMSKGIVLKATKSSSGIVTADIFYEHIIAKRGVPLSVRSDSARAFVGEAMKQLKEDFGIKSIDTKGYNPTGNATCERVFRWVNKVFRSMTPEEYQQWHKYVPLMALAWNSMYHKDIGCTPFEIETGMKCRNIAQSLSEELSLTPSANVKAALDLTTVRTAVLSYRSLANLVRLQMKRDAASRLNSKGKHYRAYEVGDNISYYKPMSAIQLQALNRKPKHALFE